ncbi:hypothetical protein NOR51B_2051 [Luminiphilus syltensis NOR5-1B]|uniref:Uncharacterized protein n=2 Tax=Luminiphilus TaxID=1341118 RepID=B8KVS1_9GAMM|nr:hypothetical protein NOR51B_2051 [Luminiphilus syltensis NOR5-1B]
MGLALAVEMLAAGCAAQNCKGCRVGLGLADMGMRMARIAENASR